MVIDSEIGKRLKSRRKILDFSTEQLASILGCSERLYYRYEQGERPLTPAKIIILAQHLGVEPHYFWEGLNLERPQRKEESGLCKPYQRRPRLLLIEDNPTDRFIVQDSLKDANLEIDLYTCASAEEAETFLKENHSVNPMDIILVDHNLPRKSGIDLIQTLRRDPGLKHVPLIMFTNDYTRNSMNKAIESGATSYIIKPSTHEGMQTTLRGLINYWFQIATLKTRDEK